MPQFSMSEQLRNEQTQLKTESCTSKKSTYIVSVGSLPPPPAAVSQPATYGRGLGGKGEKETIELGGKLERASMRKSTENGRKRRKKRGQKSVPGSPRSGVGERNWRKGGPIIINVTAGLDERELTSCCEKWEGGN